MALLWTVWKRWNKKIFDDVVLTLPSSTSLLQEHLCLWVVRVPKSLSTQLVQDWCCFVVDVIR